VHDQAASSALVTDLHFGLSAGASGIATLSDAALEDTTHGVEALDRPLQFAAPFRQSVTADTATFAVVERVPDPFVRLQFGRVAGELLEVSPRRGAPSKKSRTTCARWIGAPSPMTSSLPDP
jgi:hypothetical protein